MRNSLFVNTQIFDPRADVLERLQFARNLFALDVQSMSEEALAGNGGGQSRCGFDFLYEMVGFYEAFANLLLQGPSEISGPQGGWIRAPREFHDKQSAMAALDVAAGKFADAILNYKGDLISDVFPSPVGPFTPLAMANLAVWHTMYHSGQLNYIQTIRGDVDFHWIPETN